MEGKPEAIQLQKQNDKLKFRLFYEHRDELKAIMALFNEKKEAKEKREKEINEECRELKRKLKSGEIDDRQYKKKRNPLKREKDYINYAIQQYWSSVLEPLFPNLGFNISDVEAFFKDPRSTYGTRG